MANTPQEWEFLQEYSEEWEAPEELHTPPRSVMHNLLLDVISSDLAGNDILAMAGRVLSAYADLIAWIVVSGNRWLGFEGVTRASVDVSFIARDVYSAWTSFCGIVGENRHVGLGKRERDALLSTLGNAEHKLLELRKPDKYPSP